MKDVQDVFHQRFAIDVSLNTKRELADIMTKNTAFSGWFSDGFHLWMPWLERWVLAFYSLCY